MLTEIQGYVPESRFCLVSVDVKKQNKCRQNTKHFPETSFSLVSADVFRPTCRGDGNTKFRSGNKGFSALFYISGSFSTRYSSSFFFITGQVNML